MTFSRSLALTSISTLALMAAAPAAAQEQPEAPVASEDAPKDDFHSRRVDERGEIVVSAIGVTQLDVLAGTSVVEGVELQRSLDTLICSCPGNDRPECPILDDLSAR